MSCISQAMLNFEDDDGSSDDAASVYSLQAPPSPGSVYEEEYTSPRTGWKNLITSAPQVTASSSAQNLIGNDRTMEMGKGNERSPLDDFLDSYSAPNTLASALGRSISAREPSGGSTSDSPGNLALADLVSFLRKDSDVSQRRYSETSKCSISSWTSQYSNLSISTIKPIHLSIDNKRSNSAPSSQYGEITNGNGEASSPNRPLSRSSNYSMRSTISQSSDLSIITLRPQPTPATMPILASIPTQPDTSFSHTRGLRTTSGPSIRRNLSSSKSKIINRYTSKFTEEPEITHEDHTSALLKQIEEADSVRGREILENHLEKILEMVEVKEVDRAFSKSKAEVERMRRKTRGWFWKRLWVAYDTKVDRILTGLEVKLRKKMVLRKV